MIVILGVLAPLRAALADGEIPITTTSEEARAAFVACRDAYESHRLPQAALECAGALRADPGLAWAHLIAGLCASSTPEKSRSIAQAQKLAARASPCEKAWIDAAAAGHQGDSQKRLARLSDAASDCPGDWRPWAEIAATRYAAGDLADASSAVHKALALAPAMLAPLLNLSGYIKAREGALDEAVYALRKAVELAPAEPNPRDSLGEVLVWSGRFGDAQSEFRAALAIDPAFAPSWAGLGHALLFAGKTDEALAAYQKLRETAARPTDALAASWWIAVLATHQGKLDEAASDFHAGAAEAGKLHAQGWAATFLFAAAQAEIEAGEWKKAQATLKKIPAAIVSQDPALARWRKATLAQGAGLAALIQGYQGKSREARNAVAAAQKGLDPRADRQTLRALKLYQGAIELAGGAADQAAVTLQSADPDDPFTWHLTALALDRKGDKAGAEILRDRIRRSHVNALGLALARRKLGETSN